MQSPSSWSRVLRLTYAAVLPLYFACGLLGYAAYGDFANANINVNFPDNLANQASIVVQMVQEVRFLRSTRPRHHAHLTPHPHLHHSPLTTHHSPLNLHPHLHPHQVYFLLSTNLVIMLALELHLGLDPAACCSPRWNGCPWLGRLPLPPWVGRLVLRSALLSSQVLVRVRVRRRSSCCRWMHRVATPCTQARTPSTITSSWRSYSPCVTWLSPHGYRSSWHSCCSRARVIPSSRCSRSSVPWA